MYYTYVHMDSQEGKMNMGTDVQTCYDSAMGKKRLIVDLDETEHRGLVNSARAVDMTVSNYVRKALSLPLLKQGVKRPEAGKKAAKRKGAK
jgi:hypothetical protein